jgi:GT2 family glycosyltransferase
VAQRVAKIPDSHLRLHQADPTPQGETTVMSAVKAKQAQLEAGAGVAAALRGARTSGVDDVRHRSEQRQPTVLPESQLLVDFLTAYHDASAPGRTRFFATSNMAVSAEAFHRLGGFDSQFSYAGGEDRDFCDRWHASGGRSAFEPEAVVYHRHPLTMQGYLAQHFRYGRGALRFHRARAPGR